MSNVVRLIALKMKENIHQLSVSIKGRPYTYFRMASTNI